MKFSENEAALFAALTELLKIYDTAAGLVPVRRYKTKTFLPQPACQALMSCIRRLSLGGQILDASDLAPQPSVCALRMGITGAFPVIVLASVYGCGEGRAGVTVRAVSRALPMPGVAKRTADRLLANILADASAF